MAICVCSMNEKRFLTSTLLIQGEFSHLKTLLISWRSQRFRHIYDDIENNSGYSSSFLFWTHIDGIWDTWLFIPFSPLYVATCIRGKSRAMVTWELTVLCAVSLCILGTGQLNPHHIWVCHLMSNRENGNPLVLLVLFEVKLSKCWGRRGRRWREREKML